MYVLFCTVSVSHYYFCFIFIQCLGHMYFMIERYTNLHLLLLLSLFCHQWRWTGWLGMTTKPLRDYEIHTSHGHPSQPCGEQPMRKRGSVIVTFFRMLGATLQAQNIHHHVVRYITCVHTAKRSQEMHSSMQNASVAERPNLQKTISGPGRRRHIHSYPENYEAGPVFVIPTVQINQRMTQTPRVTFCLIWSLHQRIYVHITLRTIRIILYSTDKIQRISGFQPTLTPRAKFMIQSVHHGYAARRQQSFSQITWEHGFNMMTWRTYLDSYHDNIVCDVLEYGWPVNYTSQQTPRGAMGNHPSATAYSSHVNAYLNTELQHGAMLGSFSESPFRNWFQTSPLMTLDKRSSDDRRVIVDLSWPTGYSINDGIPPDVYMGTPYKLRLPGPDDLAKEIIKHGPGCYLYSIDIESASKRLAIVRDTLGRSVLHINPIWDTMGSNGMPTND